MYQAVLSRYTILLVIVCLLAVPAMAADDPKEPKRFNDWASQCQTPKGSDKEVCFVFQRINAKDTGKTILYLTVAYPPDREDALMMLALPLGVALVPGIQVKVDEEGEVLRAPYNVCLPDGCRSAIKVDAGLMSALKAGNKFNVAFANVQGKAFKLPVSLNGFTAAVNSLKK